MPVGLTRPGMSATLVPASPKDAGRSHPHRQVDVFTATGHRASRGGHPARGVAIALLLLLLPLCVTGTLAGELSEVPATAPPAMSLPDLSGRMRSLDEFSGKVVLVNFWASWCTPCIRELPGLRRLAEEMHDEPFVIVSINVAETTRRVQVNVKRLGIDFPVLLDKDKKTFDAWGATILPTAYLLDRNGQIRYVGRGQLEWDRADVIGIVRTLADR